MCAPRLNPALVLLLRARRHFAFYRQLRAHTGKGKGTGRRLSALPVAPWRRLFTPGCRPAPALVRCLAARGVDPSSLPASRQWAMGTVSGLGTASFGAWSGYCCMLWSILEALLVLRAGLLVWVRPVSCVGGNVVELVEPLAQVGWFVCVCVCVCVYVCV